MHKEKGHEHKEETHHKVHHKTHHSAHKNESSELVHHASKGHLEDEVIHSLVELQKVHVNLAEKFDKLSNHIENLLSLFELAARNFAKQPHIQSSERDKEFLEKIDKLLDQNKLLAKGLTLMEDNMRERLYGNSSNNLSKPSGFAQSEMQPGLKTQLEEV